MTLIPATKAQAAKGEFRNSANIYAYNVEAIPYSTKQTKKCPGAANCPVRVKKSAVMIPEAIRMAGISNKRCPSQSETGVAPLLY